MRGLGGRHGHREPFFFFLFSFIFYLLSFFGASIPEKGGRETKQKQNTNCRELLQIF